MLLQFGCHKAIEVKVTLVSTHLLIRSLRRPAIRAMFTTLRELTKYRWGIRIPHSREFDKLLVYENNGFRLEQQVLLMEFIVKNIIFSRRL